MKKIIGNNRLFLVARESLNYEKKPINLGYISEIEFSRLKTAKDCSRVNNVEYPSEIIYRVSLRKAQMIENENHSVEYNRLISKKYGVPYNWSENRYFVEQIRPML